MDNKKIPRKTIYVNMGRLKISRRPLKEIAENIQLLRALVPRGIEPRVFDQSYVKYNRPETDEEYIARLDKIEQEKKSQAKLVQRRKDKQKRQTAARKERRKQEAKQEKRERAERKARQICEQSKNRAKRIQFQYDKEQKDDARLERIVRKVLKETMPTISIKQAKLCKKDIAGMLSRGGYQPTGPGLNPKRPLRGGSGMPRKKK